MRESHHQPLGPSADRPGQVEPGRQLTSARHDEASKWLVPGVNFVDPGLNLRNMVGIDADDLGFVIRTVWGGQIGTNLKEPTLDAGEHSSYKSVIRFMQT
jgi:hypothetical protein